jgi:hypothetical protein
MKHIHTEDQHDTSPVILAAVALTACFMGGCGIGCLIGWLARSLGR